MTQQLLTANFNHEMWDKLSDALADKVAARVIAAYESVKPRYYDRKEVADMLHISLPTLARLTEGKVFTAHRIGSRVLYNAREIDAAVASGDSFRYLHLQSPN